jgi:hypothetical protein
LAARLPVAATVLSIIEPDVEQGVKDGYTALKWVEPKYA